MTLDSCPLIPRQGLQPDRGRARLHQPALAVLVLSCLCATSAGGAEPNRLLLDVMSMAGFSKADVITLRDGALVSELDVDDRTRQVALAGLIRVDSPGSRFAEALAASPLESTPGAADAYGRFTDPAALQDIAGLRLPDGDLKVLPDCRIAECKIKLSRQGIDQLKKLDWSRKQSSQEFTRQFQDLVLSTVNRYREQGNSGLIVYADKPQPSELSTTTDALLSQFSAFQRHAPELADYLRRYPQSKSSGMFDAIDWSMKNFGYRPTLAVDHLVVDSQPGVEGAIALMARQTIYSNHYVAGRVQMGALVDGEDALGVPGRFIVLVDRIEFDDGLNIFKRRLLSGGLLSEMEQRMEALRDFAEVQP
jgi:hypothetical protein